ncbi:MAG: type IX secretion system plug protein domain-containing protein [Balneolaceae bacterium]
MEGQLPPPQSIKSLQLYRKGSANNPPIISLNSRQKLVLSFDELSDLSGQFRITFSHHNQNWEQSNIPENWFLGGMNELILGGGTKNRLSEPDYFNYSIEFPNDQLEFLTSGNFMLHVSDFSSGVRLFSVPFYVTENEGEMTSWVETAFNAGPRNSAIDQPYSNFKYPDFVEFPQFDLSFFFTQNRFWGKTKETKAFDVATPGETQYYLPRDEGFAANFDFIGLNLSNFSQGGKIIEWRPEFTPPKAVLREDVLNFTADPMPNWSSNFGVPKSGRDARYANVRFRFEDGGEFSSSTGVYLVGDFNQWLLSENYKLSYNQESGYWETSVLIKEGTYTYKYALKAYGDEVDDVTLSDSITRREQEYVSFVYYKDPDYQYQRLLFTQVFYSGDN